MPTSEADSDSEGDGKPLSKLARIRKAQKERGVLPQAELPPPPPQAPAPPPAPSAFHRVDAKLDSQRYAMAVHPFRRFTATGGTGCAIRIWSATPRSAPHGEAQVEAGVGGYGWAEVADLSRLRNAHSDMVLALEFLDASRAPHNLFIKGAAEAWGGGRIWLASAGADRTIRVWSGPVDQRKASLRPGVSMAEMEDDHAAGEGEDEETEEDLIEAAMRAEEKKKTSWVLETVLVDHSNRSCSLARTAHGDDITILAFRHACPGQPLLASGADDSSVKLWHPSGNIWDPVVGKYTPPPMGWGGGRSAEGPLDAGLLASEWSLLGSLGGHRGRVCAIAFSEGNGRLLATADSDGAVHLWSGGLRGWERSHILREDGWPVPSLAIATVPLSFHHRHAMETLYPPLAKAAGDEQEEGGWGDGVFHEARILAVGADVLAHAAQKLLKVQGGMEAMRRAAEARKGDGPAFTADGAPAMAYLKASPPPGGLATERWGLWGLKTWIRTLTLSHPARLLRELEGLSASSLPLLRSLSGEKLHVVAGGLGMGHGGGEHGGDGEREDAGGFGDTEVIEREVFRLRASWAQFQPRARILARNLASKIAGALEDESLEENIADFWAEWFARLLGACHVQAEALPTGQTALSQKLGRLPGAVSSKMLTEVAKLPDLDASGRALVALREALTAEARLLTIAATLAAQLAYVAERKAEYAATIAACGGVVLAVASPDLPIDVGSVVSVKHQRAILQAEVVEGRGIRATLRGYAAMFEGGEKTEVSLDSISSTPGVKLWRFLPVREAKAIKDVAPHQGKKEDEKARLLVLAKGTRIKLRGEGYTKGWFVAELVGSDERGGSRFVEGELGNIQDKSIEEQGHTYMGSSEWAPTHCIETGAGVQKVSFLGPRSEVLCVATDRRIHLVMRHDRGITQRGGVSGALSGQAGWGAGA
ncbi:hypothetical protein T484DRAFT_1899068, partial [Baffinella frigidus]